MERIWLKIQCADLGSLDVYVDGDHSPTFHEITEFIETCTGYQGILDTTSPTVEALYAEQEGARPLLLTWSPIMESQSHPIPNSDAGIRRATTDYVLIFLPTRTRHAGPATRVSYDFPGPGHTIVDFDESRHDPSFRGNFYRIGENGQHSVHEGPSLQNLFSNQERVRSSVPPFQGRSNCLGENSQHNSHEPPSFDQESSHPPVFAFLVICIPNLLLNALTRHPELNQLTNS